MLPGLLTVHRRGFTANVDVAAAPAAAFNFRLPLALLVPPTHPLPSPGNLCIHADNHLVLWDLRPEGLTGSKVEKACDICHVTLNKNAVVGDVSALTPGGVRIGSPAMTSRGLTEAGAPRLGGRGGGVDGGNGGRTGSCGVPSASSCQCLGLAPAPWHPSLIVLPVCLSACLPACLPACLQTSPPLPTSCTRWCWSARRSRRAAARSSQTSPGESRERDLLQAYWQALGVG